ncbi:hypothetical protein [Ammoniphilus sp. 3BR4]
MMAQKYGWDSYGDVGYVDHVFRYIQGKASNLKSNAYVFIQPTRGS